jgi:hypothetical protein
VRVKYQKMSFIRDKEFINDLTKTNISLESVVDFGL